MRRLRPFLGRTEGPDMTTDLMKRKRGGGRAGHAKRRGPAVINQAPWCVPVNPDRPTEPMPMEGGGGDP
ncbi:hypothetical protein GCM10011360_17070 [Primorskyibacter flagellatus]|uniref:Uncharacterized protein n=1 Tax=Primorskyibacter flagellatus TaxID=1387277 RepID=A0A917A626_9RHOB|nr:hypothetical protein GCM10011360_17070 [Primorskyibacter flagellatus]